MVAVHRALLGCQVMLQLEIFVNWCTKQLDWFYLLDPSHRVLLQQVVLQLKISRELMQEAHKSVIPGRSPSGSSGVAGAPALKYSVS
jgi:hypothetical protein